MFGFTHFLSHKYSTASKGQFLTFLNFISISGIAIGVMALIIVIGVMTGFGNNLREKIIGTTPHIMIEKETGIKNYPELIQDIEAIEDVVSLSPYIHSNVFIENLGQARGLVMRGINPQTEGAVTKVGAFLTQGLLSDLREDNIIIGSELARYYGLDLNDTVTIISLGSGLSGKKWRHPYVVSGIFNTGMADYDMSVVLTHIQSAQRLMGKDEYYATGIGVHLKKATDAKIIKKQVYEKIGFGFLVQTWIDKNQNLFDALFLEKWGLFIILSLMVLVASFNIISTLIVTVMSKINDIGILKSIGVPKKMIRGVFIKIGLRIGVLGTIWGSVLGFGLCYVLKTYVPVPKEIYSIDHVPVDIQLFDVTVIILSSLFISFFATIYPAIKAAKLQPVEALRYK